jgi:hypothetical protein
MEAMRWTADLRFDAADVDIFAGNAPIREASQTGDQLIGRYSGKGTRLSRVRYPDNTRRRIGLGDEIRW